MRLSSSETFSLETCGKIWKNRPFFRADMAGLGKYGTGGYGRNGFYFKSLPVPLMSYTDLNATFNLIVMWLSFGCVYLTLQRQ